MKTSIDNNQKVFMLTGDMNRSIFCNLRDVPSAFKEFDGDEIKIYYFWNNKPKRIYKKKLNEWFEGNQIPNRIH